MPRRLANVTLDNLDDLPHKCRRCVFWELDPVSHTRAQAAGDPDTGETYYRHWLATLEHLVAAKGVASTETLHRYRDAWDHAADRTPHGMPIELTPAVFG